MQPGDPVDHHRGQQVVGRHAALVGPAVELLGDPAHQADRGVVQPVGERLRPRALDVHVAALLLEPVRERRARRRLRLRPGLEPAQRHHVQVQRLHGVGIGVREPDGDARAPVAAGDQVALVAERAHQRVERVRALDDPGARPARREREAVARQRGDDHPRVLAQQRQDAVELPHAARPAVQEQQRRAVAVGEEVHVAGDELLEAVQRRLGRAPVVAVAPVRGQFARGGEPRARARGSRPAPRRASGSRRGAGPRSARTSSPTSTAKRSTPPARRARSGLTRGWACAARRGAHADHHDQVDHERDDTQVQLGQERRQAADERVDRRGRLRRRARERHRRDHPDAGHDARPSRPAWSPSRA